MDTKALMPIQAKSLPLRGLVGKVLNVPSNPREAIAMPTSSDVLMALSRR